MKIILSETTPDIQKIEKMKINVQQFQFRYLFEMTFTLFIIFDLVDLPSISKISVHSFKCNYFFINKIQWLLRVTNVQRKMDQFSFIKFKFKKFFLKFKFSSNFGFGSFVKQSVYFCLVFSNCKTFVFRNNSM